VIVGRPGSIPFHSGSIRPSPPASNCSRITRHASTPSASRTKLGSGMAPNVLGEVGEMPRRVASSVRRKSRSDGQIPSSSAMSVRATSVAPSNVRPRRRKVLAPMRAQVSSTITAVASSLLRRPGNPIGWKANTREPDASWAVGRLRMAVRRAAAS